MSTESESVTAQRNSRKRTIPSPLQISNEQPASATKQPDCQETLQPDYFTETQPVIPTQPQRVVQQTITQVTSSQSETNLQLRYEDFIAHVQPWYRAKSFSPRSEALIEKVKSIGRTFFTTITDNLQTPVPLTLNWDAPEDLRRLSCSAAHKRAVYLRDKFTKVRAEISEVESDIKLFIAASVKLDLNLLSTVFFDEMVITVNGPGKTFPNGLPAIPEDEKEAHLLRGLESVLALAEDLDVCINWWTATCTSFEELEIKIKGTIQDCSVSKIWEQVMTRYKWYETTITREVQTYVSKNQIQVEIFDDASSKRSAWCLETTRTRTKSLPATSCMIIELFEYLYHAKCESNRPATVASTIEKIRALAIQFCVAFIGSAQLSDKISKSPNEAQTLEFEFPSENGGVVELVLRSVAIRLEIRQLCEELQLVLKGLSEAETTLNSFINMMQREGFLVGTVSCLTGDWTVAWGRPSFDWTPIPRPGSDAAKPCNDAEADAHLFRMLGALARLRVEIRNIHDWWNASEMNVSWKQVSTVGTKTVWSIVTVGGVDTFRGRFIAYRDMVNEVREQESSCHIIVEIYFRSELSILVLRVPSFNLKPEISNLSKSALRIVQLLEPWNSATSSIVAFNSVVASVRRIASQFSSALGQSVQLSSDGLAFSELGERYESHLGTGATVQELQNYIAEMNTLVVTAMTNVKKSSEVLKIVRSNLLKVINGFPEKEAFDERYQSGILDNKVVSLVDEPSSEVILSSSTETLSRCKRSLDIHEAQTKIFQVYSIMGDLVRLGGLFINWWRDVSDSLGSVGECVERLPTSLTRKLQVKSSGNESGWEKTKLVYEEYTRTITTLQQFYTSSASLITDTQSEIVTSTAEPSTVFDGSQTHSGQRPIDLSSSQQVFMTHSSTVSHSSQTTLLVTQSPVLDPLEVPMALPASAPGTVMVPKPPRSRRGKGTITANTQGLAP